MDSYFSLLNLSFVENYHMVIFTAFAKQSMINQLSNPINRNRSAAKISKVMSSSIFAMVQPLISKKVWRAQTLQSCGGLHPTPGLAAFLLLQGNCG